MICHVSRVNAKIRALKANVEKKQFVVQRIIARFVFVLMDLVANQLSNVHKWNAKLMTTVN